jgi:phenylacetic acid degradation protein
MKSNGRQPSNRSTRRRLKQANVYEFEGHVPLIDPTSFVHPNATVLGDVTIGKKVYIGAGASVRADWGSIVIGDGCNIQDCCTIHSFPGASVILKPNAHIGHGAVIHGATIGANVLIGMNAVIMDNAEIGNDTIVGALTFVPGEMKIPPKKVVGGIPARVLKDASDEMIAWKSEGTRLYQTLPERCQKTMRPVISIPESRKGRKQASGGFVTWKETQRIKKGKGKR